MIHNDLLPLRSATVINHCAHSIHWPETCWLFLAAEQWSTVVDSRLLHLKYGTVFQKESETKPIGTFWKNLKPYPLQEDINKPATNAPQTAVLDWILVLYKLYHYYYTIIICIKKLSCLEQCYYYSYFYSTAVIIKSGTNSKCIAEAMFSFLSAQQIDNDLLAILLFPQQ